METGSQVSKCHATQGSGSDLEETEARNKSYDAEKYKKEEVKVKKTEGRRGGKKAGGTH